uniref:Uncharacterized protein n=1 Tax=Rhizophora mucronata TaxID=61149 RepID=A0A2P2J8P8_RHIMU
MHVVVPTNVQMVAWGGLPSFNAFLISVAFTTAYFCFCQGCKTHEIRDTNQMNCDINALQWSHNISILGAIGLFTLTGKLSFHLETRQSETHVRLQVHQTD